MTPWDPNSTYILTAQMDDVSFNWLDDLRRRHFPPESNLLPAHLTLFHRLSPAQAACVSGLHSRSSPIKITFDRIDFLGFGVAVHVRSTELERLRAVTREAMGGDLSRQDDRPWHPHVTLQNKALPETARRLHDRLSDGFSPRAGTVSGLLVWEYLGGPWKLAARTPLQGARPPKT